MQAERILALTASADIKVEPIWASLFEKALKGSDVNKLLASFSNVSAAPVSSAAAPAAAAASGKKEEAKKEVAKKEESDDDCGFGLFD